MIVPCSLTCCLRKLCQLAELLSTTANSFRVSLSTQRVLVWGPSLPSFETVTGVIAKTGKEIRGKKIVEDLALLPELDPQ